MAKKKVSNQAKDPEQQALPQKNQEETRTLYRQPSREDPAEKLQNLKSLNSLLIKETVEKRQQIECLVQAKDALQAELTRSGKGKRALEAELNQASEETVSLELEKCLFWVFVETHMREMGAGIDGLVREKSDRESEIVLLKSEVNELMSNLENERDRLGRVCQERDSIKSDFDVQIKEANGLRERVTGMEKNERNLEENIGKLKVENEGLIEEKKKRDNVIEAAKREKDKFEKNSEEKVKEIEGLKREIEMVVREKKEIAMEKSSQETKIYELEKELGVLNEIVLNLRKEEGMLREKVLELEKGCCEAMEKEKEMAMEINALVEEKRQKERSIEGLMEEKDYMAKELEMTMMESKNKEQLLEELSRKKNEIEELKLSRENELVEVQREVGELRDVLLTLQESCRDQEEKNKQLLSEASHFRDAFDRVTLERDNALKCFDDERKNGLNLMSKASKMEKRIEEIRKEFAQIRGERQSLIEERKEMESRFELLRKEKDVLQKDLLEAKWKIDDLKANMESAGINSERALAMLKNTAKLLCQSEGDCAAKEDVVISKKKLKNEIEPYAAELEAIKKAFSNKETMVEDMKRQVEFMRSSAAEAHKKKSFWTLVSSATTIFAAASVAYAARAR